AANTFSGAATINAGTLTIGVANALPAVAATVASGATLDVASNLTLSTLNTAGTTSVAGGKILTLSGGSLTGVVSGTGGLAKTGTNSLTLTSNQAYTGTTTVSDGYLVLGNQTSSGSVAGNIVNNAVLTFARSDSYSYAGVVSGSGVIFQSGGTGSILTLTGVNTYSGTTNISSGTLKLGAVNTLPTATTVSLQAIGTLDVGFNQTVGRLDGLAGSSVILGSGAKLTIAGSSGTQFDGALSGGGALALAGTGPLTLTATNLFSGGITLESGSSLSVSADANLGAVPGSATAGQLTFNGGSLQATASFSLNSNRGIGLGSGGGTIYTATTVSLSYGGIITGTGGLTKSDPGALTLGGASTYTGATLITGGKLLVTNSAGSGTGSGSVTVSSGAIFGGTGTITGPLFLNSGGIVSPGLIPGTLNVGATTFAGGSKFDFKINDATGAVNTSWNLLNISGGLTLTATSGNPFIVNLSSLTLGNLAGTAANFNSSLSYNWQFVTASAGVTGFDATAFQFNTSLFQNSLGTGNFYVSQSGNSLLLNFTPVPEPATWALLALGLSPIVLVLRRRRAFPRS
ncbi:MAG: autotransporter-associated beta strand repeat-containing protein, partial [Undibacterium sp.]|nr:autotransporter-associated beta strand repeat-containing protein [Opitutaceae bacterium]